MPNSSELAFVALGSNLGDSPTIIRQAFERLQALTDEPLLKSSLWETAPVDCPPGSPPFANAMTGLAPRIGETPETLLDRLQALEKEFGRRPKKALNEPRTLDLDLIAFGNTTRNTPRLVLPHPRAHERRFVLEPLSEIAPDFILPGGTRTVRELLQELVQAEQACATSVVKLEE
jgi:2-amino-4-hydroxy-6-hydroxymethyldihydropteridine diphosphokinase